jgi:hypothetical protein
MLVCSGCGKAMWGATMNSNPHGKRYTYRRYFCSTAKRLGRRAGGCRTNAVEPDRIRDDVVAILQKDLLNPRALARLQKSLAARRDLAASEVVDRRKALKAGLDELAAQITTATRRLGSIPDDMVADLVAQVQTWK